MSTSGQAPSPGSPAGDPAATATVRAPRVASDVVRLGFAAIAGVNTAVITLVIGLIVGRGSVDGSIVVLCLFGFSAASSIAYLIHTLRVFGRMDGPRLREVLIASTPHGRFGRIGAMVSGTGPTIAVQWSIIAVAAVLVLTVWPGLETETITVWFSIVLVAASWSVTIVAYAVHYARLDAATKALQFPDGADTHLFSDYIYLAVQVQTTFSTSDVSLLSASARRIVTGHTLVSFAFNTVIIAMLITVLFLRR